VKTALQPLVLQIGALGGQTSRFERALQAQHRASDASQRLEGILAACRTSVGGEVLRASFRPRGGWICSRRSD
jgi:hypothetical protein